LDKRLAKGADDVQNFAVEIVGLEQGPPPDEDGVSHLQDAIGNLVVGVG
jgi:hypothetical protein